MKKIGKTGLAIAIATLLAGCGGTTGGGSGGKKDIYGYKSIDIYPNLTKDFAKQLQQSTEQTNVKGLRTFVVKDDVYCTDYQFTHSDYEGTSVGDTKIYYIYDKSYHVAEVCKEHYGYSELVGQYGDYTLVIASKE